MIGVTQGKGKKTMDKKPKEIICFIPARSGSQRVPNKNIRDLCGHPLIAYTIRVAIESGIFKRVYLVSDSPEYLKLGEKYGASPALENADKDWTTSRDFDWVKQMADDGVLGPGQYFMILRPTNPFKTTLTVTSAWEIFKSHSADSVRAVKRVTGHPFKMWASKDGSGFIRPLLRNPRPKAPPYFERQTQSFLAPKYIQTGTLEISHVSTLDRGNISGDKVFPYFCQGHEGFDINTEEDWILAEVLAERGIAVLPKVKVDI